jgi:hypothetical protein
MDDESLNEYRHFSDVRVWHGTCNMSGITVSVRDGQQIFEDFRNQVETAHVKLIIQDPD